MSSQVFIEMQKCDLPIPAGWRFVRWGKPSDGEHIIDCTGEAEYVRGGCDTYWIIVEPIKPPSIEDFMRSWPDFMARNVYIALNELRVMGGKSSRLDWIMYSAERMPVYDPKHRQWSGDVLCNLSMIKKAVPGLPLPENMEPSESLRWVE